MKKMKKKERFGKKQNIIQQPSVLTWPNMTLKHPKKLSMVEAAQNIWKSTLLAGSYYTRLITTSHCACIPISRAECFIFTYIRIYTIFFSYKPRQCKAKNWPVLVALENSYHVIAKPCVSQCVCLHKLIRFSMMWQLASSLFVEVGIL